MPEDSPAARALGQGRTTLFDRASGDARALDGLPAHAARLADDYFTARLGEIAPDFPRALPVSIIAVGGYGRAELCPGSDLDVLLVYPGRIPAQAEALARALFHPLWDLRLDLGHGVRTLNDCIALAGDDPQVLASLLDLRHIAGDAGAYHDLALRLDSKVLPRSLEPFARWLAERNTERAERYGDASALLEPDLKNGLGGLRGAHQVRWLTRLFRAKGRRPPFPDEDLARLEDDARLVRTARSALHLAAGRKRDALAFELQPAVAAMLGYDASGSGDRRHGPALAVEAFLSDLHRAMARIRAMREAFWLEAFPDGSRVVPVAAEAVEAGPTGLSATAPDTYRQRPDRLLDLFFEAAWTGQPLSWPTRRLAQALAVPAARALAGSPRTLDTLLDICLAAHAGTALAAMQETGFLAALLPEFAAVEHMVQFDDYHVHPVGRHTIEAVSRLAGFFRGRGPRWAVEMAAGIDRPRHLLLAALFHDLGKLAEADGAGDHCNVGAALAAEALARFGPPDDLPAGVGQDVLDEVAFLVREHLRIPRVATKRDLFDGTAAAEVAALCGTAQRLDMLYLLTAADAMATGPRAWNDWSASLFRQLYAQVRRLLERGVLGEQDLPQRMLARRDRLRARAGDELGPAWVEKCLGRMPGRALLALTEDELAAHMRLARELEQALAEDRRRKPGGKGGRGVCLIRAAPSRHKGFLDLTIAAEDRPGLFATLAGVLALSGLDIRAADIFTWEGGLCLDVFTVAPPPKTSGADHDALVARVGQNMRGALAGTLDVAYRIAQKRSSLLSARKGPALPATVGVDNHADSLATQVEVAAPDRPGLLHDLAHAIHAQGLEIRMAKITTDAGRVLDAFTLRDGHGRKVQDPEDVERLRAALLEAAGE